jgi:hypothetical protein
MESAREMSSERIGSGTLHPVHQTLIKLVVNSVLHGHLARNPTPNHIQIAKFTILTMLPVIGRFFGKGFLMSGKREGLWVSVTAC